MSHKTYVKNTDGKTAVFFIHGFLGSTEHFERFIERLPDDVAVYNVLLHGHGGSTGDFARATMAGWKKQTEDIMEELIGKYEEIIITAHSMGTFFAMDLSKKYPEKVKQLFLLGMPLRIRVKPTAALNSIKSIFGLFSEKDEKAVAYSRAHSVRLTVKLWEYIGWIPRYLELFAESKRGRSTVLDVSVPCSIFQSKNDELVSVRSVKCIPDKENISVHVLEKSAHFIYDGKDFEFLMGKFVELFE